MNVGDIVRRKRDDSFKELGYGIVIKFEQRGYQRDYDPSCDVWTDAVVMWNKFGLSWDMRVMVEVVHESV